MNNTKTKRSSGMLHRKKIQAGNIPQNQIDAIRQDALLDLEHYASIQAEHVKKRIVSRKVAALLMERYCEGIANNLRKLKIDTELRAEGEKFTCSLDPKFKERKNQVVRWYSMKYSAPAMGRGIVGIMIFAPSFWMFHYANPAMKNGESAMFLGLLFAIVGCVIIFTQLKGAIERYKIDQAASKSRIENPYLKFNDAVVIPKGTHARVSIGGRDGFSTMMTLEDDAGGTVVEIDMHKVVVSSTDGIHFTVGRNEVIPF